MTSNHRTIALALTAVAVIALAAWPLSAQVKGQSQATQHKEIVKQMDDAQMTLAKAVEAAEKESGGRAVGVRADIESDKLSFTVQCSVGDDLKPVTVDKAGKATVRGGKKDTGKDKKDDAKPKPEGGENPRRPQQP